jgi:lysophospholipase L1-like esterase
LRLPGTVWLLLAGLYADPLMAAEPSASPIPPGMSDGPCPAPAAGQFALDEHLLKTDWAWQCRYRADNARVDPAHPPHVVFIGDSITENWIGADPDFFAHGNLDRGISGQTSPQLLVRFYQDVVALHPAVVHIMVGTNDIAGNTGPTTPESYMNAVRAMVDLARANHIAVILGAVPPTIQFGWQPAVSPGPWVARLNQWLKDYAHEQHLVFADYHTALAGPAGELPAEFSPDGVHPNAAGYAVMRGVAERAIAEADKHAKRKYRHD